MTVEWERVVRKPADACASCGQPFAPGGEIVTALELKSDGFDRQDTCGACFAKRASEPFSFWRYRRTTTDRPGPRKLDLAWLTELFKRLADRADDENARRVQWIVGLLLLRRRLLEQLSRGERDGAEVLRLRLKREEREYEIVDPRLDEAAMIAIEQDLTKMFDLRE